jgi:hypothetical protein
VNELTITVVPDEACPGCGAFWGNPDTSLDYPNRPKVGNADGTWSWRCYNPFCSTDYYTP